MFQYIPMAAPRVTARSQFSTALRHGAQFQPSSCTFPSTCAFKANQPQQFKVVCQSAHTEHMPPASRQKTVGYGFSMVTQRWKLLKGVLIHESSFQIKVFL